MKCKVSSKEIKEFLESWLDRRYSTDDINQAVQDKFGNKCGDVIDGSGELQWKHYLQAALAHGSRGKKPLWKNDNINHTWEPIVTPKRSTKKTTNYSTKPVSHRAPKTVAKPVDKPCYILCEEGTNLYKIGNAEDAEKRRSGLVAGNPRRLTIIFESAYIDEKEMQEAFTKYKVDLGGGTEWFKIPANLIEKIITYLKKVDKQRKKSSS